MNGLPIITADQRLQERSGIKGCIFGTWGIGKTSLLWTLPATTTLFIDLEAGDLAVEGWKGDTIRPKTWQECRDLAVFIGGYNPALPTHQSYSETHYHTVCEHYGDPAYLERYETLFIDSITVAGRLCFQWCKEQCLTKTGETDTRAAYGLHAQEMIAWLTHLQHTRNKNIWFVGILDKKRDKYNYTHYLLQMEGSKVGLELPGIVDQVITMAEITPEKEEKSYRAFITHTCNPFDYPAKDRSGQLDMIEKPDLGALMDKIRSKAKPASDLTHFTHA